MNNVLELKNLSNMKVKMILNTIGLLRTTLKRLEKETEEIAYQRNNNDLLDHIIVKIT